MHVDIETGGTYSRGATIGDAYHVGGKEPNALVLLDVDRPAFADLFVEAVSHWKEG